MIRWAIVCCVTAAGLAAVSGPALGQGGRDFLIWQKNTGSQSNKGASTVQGQNSGAKAKGKGDTSHEAAHSIQQPGSRAKGDGHEVEMDVHVGQ